MTTYHFTNLSEAARQIKSDAKKRDRRVRKAINSAAQATSLVIKRDVAPKAFGDLADSIHVELSRKEGVARIIADAPHAEAVEVGSRPHMPPLEPIIAWVKLRGIQGLTVKGNVVRNTNIRPLSKGAQALGGKQAAVSIGRMLRDVLKSSKAAAKWRAAAKAGSTAGETDPATLSVARAIQYMISQKGTKPFRYMYAGITTAMATLDTFVKNALPDTT